LKYRPIVKFKNLTQVLTALVEHTLIFISVAGVFEKTPQLWLDKIILFWIFQIEGRYKTGI
jgi:hypothetical protein